MRFFFRLTAPRCPGMAAGAVSLRKSHDIVILSFCNIVKGQATYTAGAAITEVIEFNLRNHKLAVWKY